MIYMKIVNLFKYLTGSQSDEEFNNKLLVIAWVYLIIVFIQSQFFPAPYGKFNSKNPIFLLEKIR